MKWLNRNNDTSNFEDRRGRRGKSIAIGGVGGIIVILLALFLGQDPGKMMDMANSVAGGDGNSQESVDPEKAHAYEEWKDFTLGVFNSCNDVWSKIFREELKQEYTKPTLVAFTDQTTSACGGASASMGPFYCPADTKVYIDLSFFKELAERFKAPGDLAMAYVTAHEVGHHVQNLLGISDKLHSMRGRISDKEYNRLSVKLELQADFFGGLWAHYADKMGIIKLEEGDLESAIAAAQAIGDDALQKAAQGYTVPDSFTHGTSAQRVYWFKKGFVTGDFSQGDTFGDTSLN
ncbi:neutral zinc metallopeptidase [Porphyromonas pogonae]|uniref:KPN_02809 family neutral zinc metallopeptidase n=1 Tax=Porphyromonas pogonae TaxID=867595 RepID=UPI002E75E339|nr:neutral zinc metallopeptidase [Porphyromonas pogonae]